MTRRTKYYGFPGLPPRKPMNFYIFDGDFTLPSGKNFPIDSENEEGEDFAQQYMKELKCVNTLEELRSFAELWKPIMNREGYFQVKRMVEEEFKEFKAGYNEDGKYSNVKFTNIILPYIFIGLFPIAKRLGVPIGVVFAQALNSRAIVVDSGHYRLKIRKRRDKRHKVLRR